MNCGERGSCIFNEENDSLREAEEKEGRKEAPLGDQMWSAGVSNLSPLAVMDAECAALLPLQERRCSFPSFWECRLKTALTIPSLGIVSGEKAALLRAAAPSRSCLLPVTDQHGTLKDPAPHSSSGQLGGPPAPFPRGAGRVLMVFLGPPCPLPQHPPS